MLVWRLLGSMSGLLSRLRNLEEECSLSAATWMGTGEVRLQYLPSPAGGTRVSTLTVSSTICYLWTTLDQFFATKPRASPSKHVQI